MFKDIDKDTLFQINITQSLNKTCNYKYTMYIASI